MTLAYDPYLKFVTDYFQVITFKKRKPNSITHIFTQLGTDEHCY